MKATYRDDGRHSTIELEAPDTVYSMTLEAAQQLLTDLGRAVQDSSPPRPEAPKGDPNRLAYLLGQTIQTARQRAGARQEDTAEDLDIGLRTVGYDEQGGTPDGEHCVTLRRVVGYAKHYGMSPQELLLRAGLFGTMGDPELELIVRARMASIGL